MPNINVQELHRRYELDGPRQTVHHLREALQEGHLRPQDFSIRDLAEALVPDGREWVRALDPRHGASNVLEAGEAVDTTAFSNITGQIIYTRILDAFRSEVFVCSGLVDTIPTRFDGEKIPGVGRIKDEIEAVPEGMPYEHLGFNEDWIETPATVKRGFIVPVTREAIYFDRTSLVLRRASEVGEILGINKEKRIADLIAGVVNNFNWKGVAYNTYQTSTPWVNDLATNALIDWTDVDAAEQAFANILDPNTNEPVLIESANMTLLTVPALMHTARRVLNATENRSGDITAGAGNQTLAPNTLDNYQHRVSRFVYRRLIAAGKSATNAAKYWWLGDFRRAFAYMENWPITVTQAPTNSEAEFTQDIVLRFKASERGAAAVLDPRYVTRNSNDV